MKRSEIIKFENDTVNYKSVASVLKVDTINSSSIWEIVDPEMDSVVSILVDSIIKKLGSYVTPGIYCAIFKNRNSVLSNDYTVIRIDCEGETSDMFKNCQSL